MQIQEPSPDFNSRTVPKFCSIVILTYNKLDYTRQCMESIRKFTAPGSYEIIIVDNHSTDGTVEWLKAQQDIRTILNTENMGFPKGCNQGIEIARGDSILLLNNDVVVTPNWLENLTNCLYSDDNIGAVGPVTNSCPIQEIKVSYRTMDEMLAFSKDFNISNSYIWENRLKLIGFCMLIKKDVIDKIGLLDERFSPGNFEDDDYSFRLLKAGYRLVLCKDTFVHHYGSISFRGLGKHFSEVFTRNKTKFIEKWGFDPTYSAGIRQELIDMIQEPRSQKIAVLDVGCACGGTLLQIRNLYKSAELYGIELCKGAADIASTFAEVSTQNVEEGNPNYSENSFDYIIFADVLEHLQDPWQVLRSMNKLLKPDGKILASIPNVMHFSIFKNLLNGLWAYADCGILDKTHLRFFTLHEIRKMFLESGYKDLHVSGKVISKGPEDEKLLEGLRNFSSPELSQQFEVFQYYIKATSAQIKPLPSPTDSSVKKKTFVTIYPETENFHLTKDVGMIPYIMHKYFNYDSKIVCYRNGEYPYLADEVKGLKIDFIEKATGDSESDTKSYIIKNALDIDFLHLFHLCKRSLNLIVAYKALNPKGKVYLKLDSSVRDKQISLSEPIIGILRLCDLISVETKHLHEYFNRSWQIKVEYLPNGFYDHGKRERVSYEDKENIICTVGRIGSPEKAHHVLMEAFSLASPYLDGWKLKIIGPVAEPFKAYTESYFERNNHLRDKIIFTGEIADKKLLDKEYKRSKVFCMTSKYESFGLVFVEAARNGCFIISSDILPAWDITDNKKHGEIVEVGNVQELADALVRCCSDDNLLRNNCGPVQDFAYDNFYWVEIGRKIDDFLRG